TPATWEAFCAVLDRPDLLESSQYITASARHDHREELVSAIEASTSSRTVADLVAAFQTAGVPCAPIQDYEQAFADPQVTARGFLWDGAHPALGTVEQLGSPMRFSTTPTRRDHAGPSLGADTVAVLAELGFATETTP